MTIAAPHPDTYLVWWPSIDVVKAGFSQRRRWRAFTRRGALVVAVWHFKDAVEAFAHETLVDRALQANGARQVFDSAAAALPFLGGRGDGYRECWEKRVAFTALLDSVRPACGGACGRHDCRSAEGVLT